jgi:hypothetical protein
MRDTKRAAPEIPGAARFLRTLFTCESKVNAFPVT